MIQDGLDAGDGGAREDGGWIEIRIAGSTRGRRVFFMLDTVGEVACAVVVIGGVQIVPFAVGAIVLEVVIAVVLVGNNRAGCQCRGHEAQQHENGQRQTNDFPISLHVVSPLLFTWRKQKQGR